LKCCFLCFFFSSRRRHTRFSRDWSSDVCSSDLFGEGKLRRQQQEAERGPFQLPAQALQRVVNDARVVKGNGRQFVDVPPGGFVRSEERRVGKECIGRRGRARS